MDVIDYTNSTINTISNLTSPGPDIMFICKFEQGFEFREGLNWLIHVSYSCFTISLFFWNIFYIRSIIAIGSGFFCVWAWTIKDIAVQLDHFSYNFIYAVINFYRNYRLLCKLMPPKFDEEETEIYERDFKETFSSSEFRMLLNQGRREYLSSNESQICKYGQSFKEIIYVAQIYDRYRIVLEDNDGNMVSEVKQGSWIGINENAIREDYMQNEKIKEAINGKYELIWQISATLRDDNLNIINRKTIESNFNRDLAIRSTLRTEVNDDELSRYQFIKKRVEGCVIYRFPIEVRIYYYYNYYYYYYYCC